jgi:diguanylate cyclase (GGDEF)-like protein/PAS domain S-box-containing protein
VDVPPTRPEGLSAPGLRRRLAPFALLTVLAFGAAALPTSVSHPWALEAAAAATVALAIVILAVPWRRLPSWSEALPPLAFLVVVILLRHSRGGSASGYAPLAVLPVVWLALYGSRTQMLLAAGCCGASFFGSILLFDQPIEELRRAVMWTATAPLIGLAMHAAVTAQRSAQAATETALLALGQSERRRRTISEAAGDVLFETDAAGRWSFLSEAWEPLTGLAVADVLGQSAHAFVHPDDRAERELMLQGLLGGRRDDLDGEHRFSTASGETRWALVQARAIRDDDGTVTAFAGTMRDVTERKHAQLALEASERRAVAVEERFERAFASSPLGLAFVDVEGRFEKVNPALEAMLGRTADALAHETIGSVCHPDDLVACEAVVPRLLAGEATVELEKRWVRPDGTIATAAAHAALLYDGDGRPTGLYCQYHDVTAAKRAEQMLLERERLLGEAQALAHVGSWERDADDPHAAWSPELCRIFGRPLGTAPTFEEFIACVHPDDRELALGGHDRQLDGEHADSAYRIVRPDGEVRWVHSRRFGQSTPGGEVTRLFGTIQDVTELRAAERDREDVLEQLSDAVQLARLGSYAWEIGDDEMWMSDQLYELFGHPRDQPPGSLADVAEYVHPDDKPRVLELVESSRESSALVEAEYRIVPRDGGVRWVHSRRHAQRDGLGQVVRVVGTLQDITERKMSEAAVRSAEERFRGAFDDAPIGMAIVGLDGHVEQANDAMCAITGRTRAELVGQSLRGLVHPGDVDEGRRAMQSLARGLTRELAVELRFLHPAGTPVDVAAHGTVLRDAAGRPTHMLGQFQDVTERKHFETRLQFMADHDPLTGLLNRRKFEAELERHVTHVKRYGAEGAVIVLDIDHFKSVNDAYGHNAGDELIVSIAATLRERLRESDLLARLGGDEFAVLLPKADVKEATHVAEMLVLAIRTSTTLLNGEVKKVTTSLGVAMFAGDAEDLSGETIVIDADLAMYDAKEAGRDRFAFYATSEHRVSRTKARLTWATRIEHALDHDRFLLMAHPILDLRAGDVRHHELLVRMLDDDDEVIPPATFLYIAERFGLVGRLDEWVTLKAIDMIEQRPELRLAVNISGRSLGDQRLLDTVEARLRGSAIDPGHLVFEVTETAAVANVTKARAFAERLRDLGCRFALDDFGAGFGSFYYLKHLPFDFVKIDGEFVQHAVSGRIDQLVIEAVVGIAQGLGKQTVAEFVTTEETKRLVQRLGVDFAQGDFVGAPVPALELFGLPALRA